MARPATPIMDRFWPKVQKGETTEDCWLWTAALNPDGYGHFISPGPTWPAAHRVAYAQLVGEIPVGFELDHLCRVRRCVNPWHLEPVSHRTNVLRGDGLAAHQTKSLSCKHGHPWTSENTHIRADGKRACLACRRERYTKKGGRL